MGCRRESSQPPPMMSSPSSLSMRVLISGLAWLPSSSVSNKTHAMCSSLLSDPWRCPQRQGEVVGHAWRREHSQHTQRAARHTPRTSASAETPNACPQHQRTPGIYLPGGVALSTASGPQPVQHDPSQRRHTVSGGWQRGLPTRAQPTRPGSRSCPWSRSRGSTHQRYPGAWRHRRCQKRTHARC